MKPSADHPPADAEDHAIDRAAALERQAKAREEGDLLIWTVTLGTRDYPGLCAARPFSTALGAVRPLRLVLLDPDLPALRETLESMGLTRLARDPGDDPVIVESWV